MQLRLKLAAAASVTALVASLVVALAGPAAAVDDQELCTVGAHPGCSYMNSGYTYGWRVHISSTASFYWNAPPVGHTGQISVYNNGSAGAYCMSIDHNVDANVIQLEPCSGLADEEWKAESIPDGGTQFYNADYNLCLNDRYYAGEVNAAPCPSAGNANPNENWSGDF